MKQLDEDKFKVLLSADLIIFLLRFFLRSVEEKDEVIQSLIEAWKKQIDSEAEKLKSKWAKQIATTNPDEYMTEDVAMILLGLTNVDKEAVKEEFILDIHKTLLESVCEK